MLSMSCRPHHLLSPGTLSACRDRGRHFLENKVNCHFTDNNWQYLLSLINKKIVESEIGKVCIASGTSIFQMTGDDGTKSSIS